MRGRNNNNNNNSSNSGRRGQNPLTRVFESNGPDVKIRGTAAHIAEKYVQLARDSLTSGDHVAAENYLQHAEHYFRTISAAQAQFQPAQGFNRADESREDNDDDDEPLMMPGLTHPGLARLHEQERSASQPQPPREPPSPRDQPALRDQPRYSDQPRYPEQPRFVDQPRFADQPQPTIGSEASDEAPAYGGLPAFITGAQPVVPAAAGSDAEREARTFRRRRRHRFPRGEQPGGEGGEGGADPAPAPAGEPSST
ncbi:DUF4167 domain-containing protein [Blastochloris viridis]